MNVQHLLTALWPVVLTGLFGTGAHLIWSTPDVTIAAAVLGAGVGALAAGIGSAPVVAPAPPMIEELPAVDLADVVEALPLGTLVVDENRTISHANALVLEHFSLPGAVGLPVATLRSRRLLDRIDLALRRRESSSLELSLSRARDTHLKAHVTPLGTSTDVLVVVLDETQARQAQASHRDFVANASHELKTPLAAVSGIIDTLLGHAREDPAATERFLQLLVGQAERMTRLIEDLLSLNRVELNERVEPEEPEELTGLVGEVVDALRPIADVAGVDLVYEIPADGALVKADREELSQLFRNLIDNAIKYGGQGTTVTVAERTDPTDDPTPMIGLYVRDNGPGIPREDLPRLTERFYRVNLRRSREKGGTGLGLAICKHVANRHRGRLEVESKLGEGSRFSVWLPLIERIPAPGSPVEGRRSETLPEKRAAVE